MTEINSDQLRSMIAAISTTIAASSDELNRLDSALGDGDHGTSLSTAFADAVAKIAILEHPTPSDVLRLAGQSLMNRMGGASGALYGTLFTRSSAKVNGKNVLTHMDVKELWQAALDGVIQRGKAQAGDKTMIDALQPAVLAFDQGTTMSESFEMAAVAAADGAQKTSAMVAKHGRAKFAGERSLGHIDAGARSVALMFAAMNSYWKDNQHG